MLTLQLTAKEAEYLRDMCRGEIELFETDGGIGDWYEAAKSILPKLEARAADPVSRCVP
jgi:hypothetical protein